MNTNSTSWEQFIYTDPISHISNSNFFEGGDVWKDLVVWASLVQGTQSLCSQINIDEYQENQGLSRQRKIFITLQFIPDSSSPDLCHNHCFSVSKTHSYGRCHMCFTHGAEVVASLVTLPCLYGQATPGSPRTLCLSQPFSLDP